MSTHQILSRLKRLATPDDYQKIETLLSEYDQADRKRRKEICDVLEPLEEKYVRDLNPDFIKACPQCDVLISNVGFSPHPVILMAIALRPRQLFLLHTGGKKPGQQDGSLKKAEEIRDNKSIQKIVKDQVYLYEVSEDDTAHNYAVYKREILPHCTKNMYPYIDPTGGRKIMSIALATFAFQYRIKTVYVRGDQLDGLIKPFSEHFEFVKDLFEYYGDPSMKLIENLFNQRNYSAALAAVDKLKETVRNDAIAKKLDVLANLIQIYLSWDSFRHSEIEEYRPRLHARDLQLVVDEISRFQYTFFDPEKMERNIHFLSKLEKSWRNSHNQIDEYRMVDLFLNVQRRAEEKKFDDAVARLYRLTEMCLTFVLLNEYQLGSTKAPNYETICQKLSCNMDELQVQFKEKAKCDFRLANLGVEFQAKLLLFLNHPVGHKYEALNQQEDGKLSVMSRRNRSILAHGTVPVDDATYELFLAKTADMIRFIVKRYKLPWDDLVAEANHPNITLL